MADRNRSQKHLAQARIILGSANWLKVAEVAKPAWVGRPAVWRWQRRFAEAGVEGLLRDAARKPGKAPRADRALGRFNVLERTETSCGLRPSAAVVASSGDTKPV